MLRRRKNRKESGQAIVEFAIVLPLFMLLVFGIIDFGWLFYNYTMFENSARNGARFACVEYSEIGYDSVENEPMQGNTYNIVKLENGSYSPTGELNDEEEDILLAVCDTLPGSAKNVKVTVEYTYDTRMRKKNDLEHYVLADRSTGDVTVTVTGKFRVLTPVLGVTADNMEKDITAVSTYKVEKQYIADDD